MQRFKQIHHRRKIRLVSTFFAASLTPCVWAAGIPTLNIGDQMPKLKDVQWLSSEQTVDWEKGRAYVIQFWSSWCLPCIAEFPELSKLQLDLREKEVSVVGVAVMGDEGIKSPAQFLSERNDVHYPMADDVENKIRARIMKASGTDSIPTLMLVDRMGRFVWAGLIGDEFHEILASIVDGSFDMDAAIDADKLRLRGLEIREAAAEAERAKDWERVAELWTQQGVLDPERYGWIWVDVYQLYLSHISDPERANLVAERYFEGPFGEDPGGLLVFVARIIGAKSEIPEEHKDLDMALRAATLATIAESNMQANAFVNVAQVQYKRGELEEAIIALERAISLLPSGDEDRQQLLEAIDQIKEEQVTQETEESSNKELSQ